MDGGGRDSCGGDSLVVVVLLLSRRREVEGGSCRRSWRCEGSEKRDDVTKPASVPDWRVGRKRRVAEGGCFNHFV